MGRKEEQYTVQETIEQGEPPSPAKQAIIAIVGVGVILTLPMILEWLTGGRPGRF